MKVRGRFSPIVDPTVCGCGLNAILHGGRKDVYAGNNGLGQSAIVRNTWLTPVMTAYPQGWGGVAFQGGVFDGQNIWLVPDGAARFVKVNPITGGMTSWVKPAGTYIGGVFDGTNIWLVPNTSANLVKVNPATGGTTLYAHGMGANAFVGGVFDGQNIWLVPNNSVNLVKVNPATGGMTSYAVVGGVGQFVGGVFDGQNIWLVPYNSTNLVKVNPTTGAMTPYAHGMVAGAFAGGVFDGQNVWLVPAASANLVKVNPATGGMMSYAVAVGVDRFCGGVFDGQNIWLVPYNSANLVKVNPATGGMTSYAHGAGAIAFRGGVFDGQNIWLVSFGSANLIKLRPQEFGRGGAMPAVSVYASGAVYSLTAVSALLGFGGTTPLVVIPYRGVWKITATCRLNYTAATLAANQTVTLKLRRTNNGPADLANATASLTTRVIAAPTTDNVGMALIEVVYETENDNDQIELWGSIDVIPGAGTIDAVEAKIVAERFDDNLT